MIALLVYVTGRALTAVQFDRERLETMGSPMSVVDGLVIINAGGGDFTIANGRWSM
jgi:hypothetical protein